MNQYPQQSPHISQPAFPDQPAAYPSPGFPPYSGPPQFMPAPRKNRTLLYVVLILIGILLLGGGGAAAYFLVQGHSSQTSPMATLQKFCDGWKKENVQEMYDTLSSNGQAQAGSEAKMQQDLRQQTNGNCTVSDLQQNGSTATALLLAVYTDSAIGNIPVTEHLRVTLVQENGQWKIDSVAA